MTNMTTATLIENATAIVRQRIANAKKASGHWVAECNMCGVPNLVNMMDDPATYVVVRAVVHTDKRPSDSVVEDISQHIANHGPDVMLPMWAWALETLGQWHDVSSWPEANVWLTAQAAVNCLAESLARVLCGSATHEHAAGLLHHER